MGTGVLTRAKKTRLEPEECHADRISSLDDGVLGDIISLLPTKDGARTQLLSSRWRHLWRSAPLNLEVRDHQGVHGVPAPREVSRILASHPGPARRFSISYGHNDNTSAVNLSHWLRHPALDKLQELHLDHVASVPESALRSFSSTLRVATFSNCNFQHFLNSCPIQLPLLKQLSLVDITIHDHGFHALLAACPNLKSLMLGLQSGFRGHIVSPSLINIGVHSGRPAGLVPQLVIKDAPCLQRLLFLGEYWIYVSVSVISAPRLHTLGKLCDTIFPRFHSATSTVQGSNIMGRMTPVVSSVKVLALSNEKFCLNEVINLIKCFPHLERLYIQITHLEVENCEENIGALDIRLRKIVLANYRGSKSHVQLAKFLISNASVLELMRFEIAFANVSYNWIERQHSLLKLKKRASMGAQFDFVCEKNFIGSCTRYDEVHDLSIMDPFQRING